MAPVRLHAALLIRVCRKLTMRQFCAEPRAFARKMEISGTPANYTKPNAGSAIRWSLMARVVGSTSHSPEKSCSHKKLSRRRDRGAPAGDGGAFLPRPPDIWIAATTIIFQAHPFAALPQHLPLAVFGGIPSSPRSLSPSELDIDFRAVLGRGVPLVCLAHVGCYHFRSAHVAASPLPERHLREAVTPYPVVFLQASPTSLRSSTRARSRYS